jgi:hypothetical protein
MMRIHAEAQALLRNTTMIDKSLSLAQSLIALHDVYAQLPGPSNPDGFALVRIVIDSPLRDNGKTSSALRGFVRRTRFDYAGATSRTVRLFSSRIDCLADAARELRVTNVTAGKAFIERFAGIQTTADIGPRIGQADLLDDHLAICFHNLGETAWLGITTMLFSLGGSSVKLHRGIQNLGYGSVRIDHAKAAQIAQHPLVRDIDVVNRITLRRSVG